MNATAGTQGDHFVYFPGNCQRDYLPPACELADWLEEKFK